MSLPSSQFRTHAVVIGASVGGMCAAEALSTHFERVTLVERDVLPDTAEPRRGVPQGNQPHGLQLRGRKEFDALFPGLMSALKAEGAFEFDASLQMARMTAHGWAPRFPNVGATAFAGSRPLLELCMRRLLLARRSNVRLIEGTRVTEPLHEQRDGAVWITGVRTDSQDPAVAELNADLVVDATGRGTKAPKWMAQLGLPEPEEIRVDSKCNYAARHYRAPDAAKDWWWRAMLVDSVPPDHGRAVSILTVEKQRWIVTAIGSNGDYAPTDEAGWLSYIKSLRSPIPYELLQQAEPLTDIIQNRTTVNWWKRMHRYKGNLCGLLLFGDAVCGFNPSYGQGLTASALAAQTLSKVLSGHAGPLDARFLAKHYKGQADFLEDGWAYSTTLDLRWPKTEGKRPPFYGLTQWATNVLEQVAIHDPNMLRRLAPLFDFGAKRTSVITPDFIARSLLGLMRHVFARPVLPAHIDAYEPGSGLPQLSSGRAAAE